MYIKSERHKYIHNLILLAVFFNHNMGRITVNMSLCFTNQREPEIFILAFLIAHFLVNSESRLSVERVSGSMWSCTAQSFRLTDLKTKDIMSLDYQFARTCMKF